MKSVAVTLLLLLAGCDTGPTYYARQPWARVSVPQAEAECANYIQTVLTSSMTLCMQAKGWTEQ